MSARKCFICNCSFRGRSDAKTCSPRCRKRLQLIRDELAERPAMAGRSSRRHSLKKSALLLLLGLSSLAGLVFSSSPPQAHALTPANNLNFQARLLNAAGAVVPDGNYNIEFKLYKSQSAGASGQGTCVGGVTDDCLWIETRTGGNQVAVTNGYFSVNLGSVNAFSNANTSLNWDQQYYLTMRIGGTGAPSWDPEMLSGGNRIALTSVPLAFRANQLAVAGTNEQILQFANNAFGQDTTISLPDPGATTATVCYRNDASGCGLTGLSGYIQLQGSTPGTAQTGNFNISGGGAGTGIATNFYATNFDVATSNTAMNIGTANAAAITIGNTANSTVTVKTKSSTTAFQVQDSSGTSLLNVDSTNARIGVDVTYAAMSAPTGLTLSQTTGGSLTALATYKYKVTAIDSAGGETLPSTEQTITLTGSNQTIQIYWTAVTGASGYKIYRTAANGAGGSEVYLTTVLTNYSSANKFSDAGTLTAGTAPPPASGNAYTSANNSNSALQLSIGGLGTPTGQLYVSGAQPRLIGSITTGPSTVSVVAVGNYTYVMSSQGLIQVYNTANPVAPALVGSANNGNCSSQIVAQGHYIYAAGGGACVGRDAIYDISNPASPVQVSTFAGGTQSLYISGKYLYTQGTGSLSIWDVSNPASPKLIGYVATQSQSYGVAVQGKYAYVTGLFSGDGLQTIDVSNPANPIVLSTITTGPSGLPYIQGNYMYVTDGNGGARLDIFDISSPSSPSWISAGLSGIGTYTSNVFVQGRYLYFPAKGFNQLKVIDVSNPYSPIQASVASTDSNPVYVYVQGRYAYVANNGSNTLQIFDIGGAYVQQLQSGGLETDTLAVDGYSNFAGDANVQGGLGVGQSLQVGANAAVAGGINVQGNTVLSGGLNQMATPSAPSVTPQGTTGAQRWDYSITAVNSYGNETSASAAGTTAIGNATLNATNFNRLSWSAVPGASSYRIYRTFATGGSPSTTGLIAMTSNTTTDDTGWSTIGGNAPTLNSTGQLTVTGSANFQNTTNSTTAFQVQNAAGKNVLDADTLNGAISLGNAGASGVTGKIFFNYSGSSGSIGLVALDPSSSSYTINLPAENGTLCTTAGSAACLSTYGGSSSQTKVVAMGTATGCTGSSPVSSADTKADYIVTSCTSAQTIINTAITALGSTGGTVYLKEGTYIIDGTINLASNVKIAGSGMGTILKFKDSTAAGVSGISGSSVNNITISDLVIDGNRANNGANNSNGILMNSVGTGSGTSAVPGFVINNVVVQHMHNIGLQLNLSGNNSSVTNSSFIDNSSSGIFFSGNAWNNLRVNNNTVSGSGGIGVDAQNPTNSTFSGNIVESNGGTGFKISSGTNNTVTGNTFKSNVIGVEINGNYNTVSSNNFNSNTSDGIYLNGSNLSAIGNTISGSGGRGIEVNGNNNSVAGNRITTSTGNGIFLHGNANETTGNVVTSSNQGIDVNGTTNTISGNTLASNSNNGIYLESGSNQNNLSGNAINSNSAYGIFIDNSSQNQIDGNRIHNNGGSGSSDGIQISSGGSNPDRNSITNNQITDTAGTGFAINLTGGSAPTNTYLSNNTYSGTGASSINNGGTGTIFANQLTATGGLQNKVGTDSTTAFQVQNASGGSFLTADTSSNNLVQIGSSTTDATAILTVLDSYNNGTDPTGVNGAMYYNTSLNAFRCFQNGVWVNCAGSGAGTLSASYNAGSTSADQTLNLDNAKGGGIILKDNSTPITGSLFSVQNNSGGKFLDVTSAKITVGENTLGNASATATTATTSGTGTNTTTVALTAVNSLANGDVIFIDNAGQDYFTRITAGGGTTSLTVDPAVTYENARTVTKYNVQYLGSDGTNFSGATRNQNSFYQGYFLGGVVTGAGSTVYSDANISSVGNLKIATATGLNIQGTNSTTAFQVQNAAGTNILNVDSSNLKVSLNQSNFYVTDLSAPTSPGVAAGANTGGNLSGAAGTTYYYKITALNAAGESLSSSEVSINGQSFTKLTAPTAPTAALGAAGNVTGTYTYKVAFVTANGETTAGTASASISPSAQQVNLTAIPLGATGTTGRNVYRCDSAGNNCLRMSVGTTIANNTTTTLTDNTASYTGNPAPPGANTATTSTNNATVSWAAVTGATSYRIYRGTAAGAESAYQTSASSPFTDSGAAGTAGTVHTYSSVDTIGIGTSAPAANLDVEGTGLFKNGQDSTNAFQVQNAAGASVLAVDTSNKALKVAGGATYNTVSYSPGSGFSTHTEYTTGSSPQGVTIGDFNGDGKKDMAVANDGSSTVSVFLGNGDGTFSTKTDYPTLGNLARITSADFNGDGNIDLAVSYGSGSISISILQGNGDGTFSGHVDYGTTSGYMGIMAADLNGDTYPDIVVGGGGNVRVFLNNGAGSFSTSTAYAITGCGSHIDIADFNGDGKPDIAADGWSCGFWNTLINNGDGTFSAGVTGSFGLYIGSGIAASDFNGDGKPDIALAYANLTTLQIYINNGDGTFGSPNNYTESCANNGSELIAADIDGDGKKDIVESCSGGSFITVYTNNGSGGFSTRNNYTVSSNPLGLAAADLNGDGSIDLAAADSGTTAASILLNGSAINTSHNGTISLTTSSASTAGLIIQGSAGQTDDLVRVQNSAGSPYLEVSSAGLLKVNTLDSISGGLNIGANSTSITLNNNTSIAPYQSFTALGGALFQDATNSSTAFRIQNAGGYNMLTADSTNMKISVSNSNFLVTDLSAPSSPSVAAGATTGGSLLGAAGTTYYYKITALNTVGESLGSSEVSINGQSFSKLAVPGAPTVGAPSAGGSVDLGLHSYKVTFVTANGETTGGTTSSQVNVTTGGTQTVPLTAIPTGATGTTARNIYRTVSGDTGSYKLVGTIANNTTTTFNDTVADASLGVVIPASNTATTNTNTSSVSWSAVTGATSYRIYRGTAAGTESAYQTSASSPFTDTGAAGTAASVPTRSTVAQVGIGTSTPSANLDVRGTAQFVDNSGSGGTLGIIGSNFTALGSNGFNFKPTTDSTTAFQLQSSTGVNVLSAGYGSITTQYINDNLIGSAPTGTLYDSATWVSGQYVQLNPASSGTDGELEYTPAIGTDDYTANFEFFAGGGSGADATFFYANSTSRPTSEGQATGGYQVYMSEYNNRLALNFNGTDLATYAPGNIGNSTWHTVKVVKSGTNFQVFYDATLRINYTDITRTLTGTKWGLGARSGGSNNNHRVRNFNLTGTAIASNIFNVNGSATFKTDLNNSNSFQIQNSSGIDILNSDSANMQIAVQSSLALIDLSAPTSPSVAAGANTGGNLSGAAGTTYYYKITAMSGSGESLPSSEVSINGQSFTKLTAPTAPTAALGAAGNVTGTYTYKVTFVTANGETTAGTASASVSPSAQQVSLTAIPVGPTGTTGKNVYRCDSAGNNCLRMSSGTTLANGTTTLTDNTASYTGNPAPPGASTATTSTNNATVSWTAVTGATSYRIYRGTAAGTESAYQTSASSPFTDTGAAGTAASVPTRSTVAQVGIGTSTPSANLDVRGTAQFVDNSGSGGTLGIIGSNFTALGSNGFNFKVSSSLTSAFQVQNAGGQQVLAVGTTNNSLTVSQGNLTVSGLSNPTTPTLTSSATGGTLPAATYYYQVAATNSNGSTIAKPSNPASVTTAGSVSQNTLTWTAVSNAANYKVYRSTDGATWKVNTIASTLTSIVDNGSNYTWGTTGTIPSSNTTGGNLSVNGTATFASQNNTSNAFDVQDASGDSILRVDSTDRHIGINNSAPVAALDVVASAPAPDFTWGFEDGTYGAFGHSGFYDVSTANPHSGSYAWGDGADFNSDTMTLTRSLSSAGTISFYAYRHGFVGGWTVFWIDGVSKIVEPNGTIPYTLLTFPLSAGTHTFQWSSGDTADQFYVDDIVIGANAPNSNAAVFNGGNVGIGTVAPSATLETDGTSIFKATSNVTSTLQVQNAAGDSLFNADTTNTQITIGRFVDSSLSAPASPGVAAGANTGGNLLGTAGTTYYYKVSAMTVDGETPLSGEVSINGQSFTKLTAPTAPTVGAPSAGGSVDLGLHSYKVTFVTANGETTGGTTSTQVNVTTGGTQTVPLTAIPTGPTGTTQRKIYRTVAGDTGSYLLVTTIANNTTTTYNDTTADASLGAAAPASSTATTSTNNATISWSAVTGATSYRVYRGTASGAETSYQTAASSPFTDTGAAGTSLSNTSLAVKGTTALQNVVDSTTAFQIQNASGISLFTVDTTSSTITLGTASATPVILVLGNKNSAGDPACTSGAVYYNSNYNQFRACVNGSWSNFADNTGWVFDGSETWSYASGSSFTVSGNLTSKYTPGTRIELTQSSTIKYFVVTSSSYSSPNTTVNITGGDDYSLANSAVSSNMHSYAANPQGYPSAFSYTSTLTGVTSIVAQSSRFAVIGRTVYFWVNNFDGTSNSTSFSASLPIACAQNAQAPIQVKDNGIYKTSPGRMYCLTSSSTTLIFQSDYISGGWTSSGEKQAGGGFDNLITYQL